ncbi:transposase family protein [Synechococcus sp. CS-1328]|uniref:transposase family protein n=1 Tax=Synechococcus sp. CS-1328 TaxID=2847976 RepID=UPI00223BA067|nr:transposase family protein [Synechococcus sp. CS-1328]MCT0224788.1 transposase family protein [Synechococcus sp. CS-1328]
MPESVSAATDLDLISYLKAIPDARMRRGVRIPAWYLLLVAVLGILSRSQSLRDLERFAIRHHSVLTEALGLQLRRHPGDDLLRCPGRGVLLRRSSCLGSWIWRAC